MQVACRETDLAKLEDPALSSEEVYQKLLPLPGIKPGPLDCGLQQSCGVTEVPCYDQHMYVCVKFIHGDLVLKQVHYCIHQ